MDSDSASSPSLSPSPQVADHPQSPDANDGDDISSSPGVNPSANESDEDRDLFKTNTSDIESDRDTSKSEPDKELTKVAASDSDDSDDDDQPIRRVRRTKTIDDSDDEDESDKSAEKLNKDDEDDASDKEPAANMNKDSDEEDDGEEKIADKKSLIDEKDSDADLGAESSDSDGENAKQAGGSKTKMDKLKEAEEIFGDSESEDEEFEGFKKAGEDQKDDDDSDDDDITRHKRKRKIHDSDSEGEDGDKKDGDENETGVGRAKQGEDDGSNKVLPDISSSSDDDDDRVDVDSGRGQNDGFVYDFDIMMQKRKEQNARARKRKNTDIINDSDDIIADLIQQMKQAAEDDFELNKDRKAATRKMKMLPLVQTQLRKIDLREAFLDAGVLGVITDWLTPLPDRSLPNLQVRETMLKILLEFSIMDVERLKASGIGKAVMYLFKHPKEIKENKKRAGQLISNWARPIFNCETDYHSISKEDREQRDFDHMNKVSKRMRVEESPRKEEEGASSGTLRPGDKGWVPRARVPAPSTRDYVVRPKSTVEFEMIRSNSKKQVTRLEKHLRNFQEKRRAQKTQRAVKISIEGRKL